ncbi:MAG TPA: ATP-dependent DNA helicase [bacterium]|nr:ATP-dependent DNA helicase [bacterium]
MAGSFQKEVEWFLGPKGPLQKLLPKYECRPEQTDMAAAALRSLDHQSVLVVEAGTGTGKTLAYLVPAIYSSRCVVISTGTKALQEQLMHKDLPVLMRHFEIKAALMKGRANYLCFKRYHEFSRQPMFKFREDISHFERISKWVETTPTGDRAEIKGLPDDYSAWREVSSTSEQCLGQKCPHFRECFITRMRAWAQQADIVVVNHHLFFADLAIRNEAPSSIIPDYETVIFDEAHGLAEVASEYFGRQVSTWRVLDLSQDIKRMERVGRMPSDDLRALLKALDSAEFALTSVFKVVADFGRRGQANGGEGARFSIAPLRSNEEVLEESERARAELKNLGKITAGLGKKDESLLALSDRCAAMSDDLGFIVSQEDAGHVFWAETRGRGVIMRASPVEVGPIMQEHLFAEPMTMIFTSATLAVQARGQWSFAHFRSELGLNGGGRKVEELWLPSSYNWTEQAMLYVPDHLPDPSDPRFIKQAAAEMEKILAASKGRAFLLFTSYRNLEAAYELLADKLPYTVLKQGDAPKSELLDRFRKDGAAVLFATASFWEGVDVAGQALSCVVIDKLPFASPGDPLMSARIDRIRKNGGNPFNDYQLPAAVISLKQGLGRLIRAREDYGILAVLDSRIHKKSYGQTFISSLPPAPLTRNVNDLANFIQRHEKGVPR